MSDNKKTSKNEDVQNNNETTTSIQKGATMVKEGLEQGAYELGSKVKEEINKGQEYAKTSLHSLEECTKANPLMTIGVSFLLGMLASKLMGNSK